MYENATIRFTDFSCYFQLKCDSPVNKITNPNPSTAIPYTTIAFCLDALKIFSVNEKGEKKDLSELRKDNKERILKSVFKKIEFGNVFVYIFVTTFFYHFTIFIYLFAIQKLLFVYFIVYFEYKK